MTDAEQREAARQFYNKWHGKGNEDQDARSFWIDILQNILGAHNVTDRVDFEKRVKVDGNTKKIDAYIPETSVLIEQKSFGKKLDQKAKQSGNIELTPYEQAKRYNDNLAYNERARWIVTSNFEEIWIYDMNTQAPEPVKIELTEIPNKYPLLKFLISPEVNRVSEEMALSIEAGKIVGKIYDALYKQYQDPESEESQRSLNALCVRLVFCLYAEDADIFKPRNLFHDYMEQFDTKSCRKALRDLFRVLDQKEDEREKYLKDDDPLLASFPYVNGGLFSDENIEIPPFTDEIRDLLLQNASENFDWAGISPTIFGAVFESTLNPETRRSGGMHYTSIENIHKVIDPLFMDDLKAEFDEIQKIDVAARKMKRLDEFQDKLAGLTFLDPACGSGNFLTESYLSLRRLENKVLNEKTIADRKNVGGQISFGDVTGDFSPIKVSISQFYGIEINDFAVTVAKAALWIAESQMMKETEDVVHLNLDFLPLKTNAYIVEGNALRMDWNDVISKDKLNYIMGNPPFVGYAYQSKQQKDDLACICSKSKNFDYVAGWYFLAADYISNTDIKGAFVSTNSITQGEQVASVWKPLIRDKGLTIIFAYQTFRWDSEASIKAHVHCVIVGFADGKRYGAEKRVLFEPNGNKKTVANISPYLIDADNIFIDKRTTPLCKVSVMHRGSQPTDDGNLIFSKEEYEEIIKQEPLIEPLFRKYMMGKDFIDRKPRYCLWLVGVDPGLIRKSSRICERLNKVREFRLKSSKEATRKKADTPALFDENQQPETCFVALPKVSSERRRYVPMDYMLPETVVGDKIYIVEDASQYEFGILESNVHMAWMRAVCGRLEMRYSYSNTIVYNNFPWPSATEDQKHKIEQTAQTILDVRKNYPDSSLADLYDPLTMPPDLLKAHHDNDRAVMAAYGFSTHMSEAECVAELMKMYQALTEKETR